jgi:hypothetical protein
MHLLSASTTVIFLSRDQLHFIAKCGSWQKGQLFFGRLGFARPDVAVAASCAAVAMVEGSAFGFSGALPLAPPIRAAYSCPSASSSMNSRRSLKVQAELRSNFLHSARMVAGSLLMMIGMTIGANFSHSRPADFKLVV